MKIVTMKIVIDVSLGENITFACTKAAMAAEAARMAVHFKFNSFDIVANPGDKGWEVEDRYYAALQAARRERIRKNMDPLFKFHKLNTAGIEKAEEIAEAFDQLLTHLKLVCPEGREFAIVKTKLEEASFFAKKSMAARPDNQVAI